MCGIAVDLRRPGSRVDEPALRAVIEHMTHRGPDGQVVELLCDDRIGLAHARLSIVDLTAAGRQPMANEDGRLWVSCNGEVYNHHELRAELIARGHSFGSGSDNEVLLHGYEEWGEGVLDRVRGMFAFALVDLRTDTVIVARDRIGEKPLVYLCDEKGFLGASEIPALLQAGRLTPRVEPRALSYFLSRNLRHVPEPLSLIAGIHKLPPGHLLRVRAGEVIEIRRWWTPSWRGRARKRDLRRAIESAVDQQRHADVDVGALLSGGVDSSIVVGLAARAGGTLRTYALGRDANDAELVRARRAASRFGTTHTETTFDPGSLDRLDELIAQLGEPIALLPLTHAEALLRKVHAAGMRVVLTGNGADELFYGYTGAQRVRAASLALRAADLFPRRVWRGASRLPLPGAVAAFLRLAAVPNRERKIDLYRQDIKARLPLLTPAHRRAADVPETCPVFGPWAAAYDGSDYGELSQFLSLVIEDAHSITISADVAGMRHSVEVRAPLLDRDVVETAFRLSPRVKIGGPLRPIGKKVLKRTFAGLIGPAALEPKMGFGYGLQESDLIRGPFRDRITERILGGRGTREHFDATEVSRVVRDHLDGRADHGKLLLSLYAFETWHRQTIAPFLRAEVASPSGHWKR